MNRPKKDFIPTSLSDLNIDSISLGSNGDRHNNNSNGARFNNLNRSKATSSFNLASHKTSSHHTNNNHSGSNFSRTSKLYGSQSNISSGMSISQSVNNFNINSPTASVATDRWEQAWEDNNNLYQAPSYQPQQQREHSHDKSNNSFKHSHTTSDFRSNSINQSQPTSNRSMNHYVDDPFDDPWSGSCLFFFYSALLHQKQQIAPTQFSSVDLAVILFMVMDSASTTLIKSFFFVCFDCSTIQFANVQFIILCCIINYRCYPR